jgi:hypothetical protein
VQLFKISSLLVLLALLVAPAALVAQQPAAPAQPSAEVQSWIMEIQQLEQRLGPIQARALEDPALREAQTELNAAIVIALMQSTPEVQADLRRIETIQPELRAAQESGDEAQLRRLVMEAQQLQQRLGEAQMRVLQQPEIAAQAEAFQTRLESHMIEIEPEAQALLQRFLALQAQILAAMQSQAGN